MSSHDEERYRPAWPRVLVWVVLLVVAVNATNELLFESDAPAPVQIEPE